MKKFFAWILAIAMTLSLAACGGNNSDQDDSSQQGDTCLLYTSLVASCSMRKAPDVPWDVRDIAARQMTQNICVALDKFKNYIIILYTIL